MTEIITHYIYLVDMDCCAIAFCFACSAMVYVIRVWKSICVWCLNTNLYLCLARSILLFLSLKKSISSSLLEPYFPSSFLLYKSSQCRLYLAVWNILYSGLVLNLLSCTAKRWLNYKKIAAHLFIKIGKFAIYLLWYRRLDFGSVLFFIANMCVCVCDGAYNIRFRVSWYWYQILWCFVRFARS